MYIRANRQVYVECNYYKLLPDVTSGVHSGGVLTLTSIQSWPGLKFARLQTVAATLFTRIGKNNITIVV